MQQRWLQIEKVASVASLSYLLIAIISHSDMMSLVLEKIEINTTSVNMDDGMLRISEDEKLRSVAY